MSVLFIGKRFYTNRDALREKYGRIWQLPWHWAQDGIRSRLWLVDYHTRQTVHASDGDLQIDSTPVKNLALFRYWFSRSSQRTDKPDVVVASGDCYIGLLGLYVARRLKARFVFDVYDKYDEFAGYHALLGLDLFRYLLDNADVRLFASRLLQQQLKRSRLDYLVPNAVDTARFTPRDIHASRAIFKLPPDDLLVGYFGGMEPDRGVADLIAAVQLLRQQGMNVRTVLGGKGGKGLDIYQDGVTFLGNVPYDRMPDALAACDLLAVPYRRSPFMDAGASNKIAEALACGRPIVATRTPNLVTNFGALAEKLDPMLADPADPVSLARAIRLQAEQRVRAEMPVNMSWSVVANGAAKHLGLVCAV